MSTFLPSIWFLAPHDVTWFDISVDEVMIPQVLQSLSYVERET